MNAGAPYSISVLILRIIAVTSSGENLEASKYDCDSFTTLLCAPSASTGTENEREREGEKERERETKRREKESERWIGCMCACVYVVVDRVVAQWDQQAPLPATCGQ